MRCIKLFTINGVPTIINSQWYSNASMVETTAQLVDAFNLLFSENIQLVDRTQKIPT